MALAGVQIRRSDADWRAPAAPHTRGLTAASPLQATLWREALHLISSGVATVEDVDTAVWAGPGLRWAAMGPTMLFHLGSGPGGIGAFCERYTPSFNRWWDDLGVLHLDEALARKLSEGMAVTAGGESTADLSAKRDSLIVAMQRAISRLQRT